MKMKRLILTTIVGIIFSGICLAGGRPIPTEKIPAAVKTFVDEHFANQRIIFAEKEAGKYEVKLNNGTDVDFDNKGNWTKVDCENSMLPNALLPLFTRQYIELNFSGAYATKIEKKRFGYEVEMSNGLDLKFNHQGEVIKIDD